jgi:hypothetical protein
MPNVAAAAAAAAAIAAKLSAKLAASNGSSALPAGFSAPAAVAAAPAAGLPAPSPFADLGHIVDPVERARAIAARLMGGGGSGVGSASGVGMKRPREEDGSAGSGGLRKRIFLPPTNGNWPGVFIGPRVSESAVVLQWRDVLCRDESVVRDATWFAPVQLLLAPPLHRCLLRVPDRPPLPLPRALSAFPLLPSPVIPPLSRRAPRRSTWRRSRVPA